MKKQSLALMITSLLLSTSCSYQEKEQNPFLTEYNTPFGVPPFDQIKLEHYKPAFETGFRQHNAEINDIINNPETATFENSIVTIDHSGQTLRKISAVMGNLTSSNTSPELAEINKEFAPQLSRHYDNLYMNKQLFDRVKHVFDNRKNTDLNREQQMLLEATYKQFVRSGVNLDSAGKTRMREINQEMALLELKFKDNILEESNSYQLIINRETDLAGLPETIVEAAQQAAKQAGFEGKWMFTLDNPSRVPFLQYSQLRNLREQIYKAYVNRCNNDNQYDNKETIRKIIALRLERARLLGFKNHAEYVLDERMAKTPQAVFELCNQLMAQSTVAAQKEVVEMQKIIDTEKGGFKLAPWDWDYYAEKVKKNKFNLDEEELRPYFNLDSALSGVFTVSNKLYGLNFKLRNDIPKYHADAVVYEVTEVNNNTLGILYMDFHPRASKRSGAWMSSYRKEYKNEKGERIPPIITVVCNFTKPTTNRPALLTFDEVNTLFHEFGHALHGLLSQCTYSSISGTATPRDFVELPSQIMENWAAEPEVMKSYAKHYQTGETIPQELIDKLDAASKFNQGFITSEFQGAALLDMYWHTLETENIPQVNEFEQQVRKKTGLIDEIDYRYRSTYFQHIFNLAYSAGYYSYTWSEILEADAFQLFKEKGIFDSETVRKFKEEILEKGGSDDAMTMYINFRGRTPIIDALIERKGF